MSESQLRRVSGRIPGRTSRARRLGFGPSLQGPGIGRFSLGDSLKWSGKTFPTSKSNSSGLVATIACNILMKALPSSRFATITRAVRKEMDSRKGGALPSSSSNPKRWISADSAFALSWERIVAFIFLSRATNMLSKANRTPDNTTNPMGKESDGGLCLHALAIGRKWQ